MDYSGKFNSIFFENISKNLFRIQAKTKFKNKMKIWKPYKLSCLQHKIHEWDENRNVHNYDDIDYWFNFYWFIPS